MDELKAKVESLNDSLDSAIEELSLRGQAPEAESADVEEDKLPPEESEEEEGELAEEGESDIENQIESAIKEDENFREGVLVREEMRDLRDELDVALFKYPKANLDEVLLDIEDGVEEDNPSQVEVLVKASHDKHLQMEDSLRKTFEEEYKAKFSKEGEGGISIPQSSGSSNVPQSPPAPGVPRSVPLTEDSEWSEALRKAKVEGGGT